MVVTRRTPVVPPPPLARSHSSQGAQGPSRTPLSRDTAGASRDVTPGVAAASLTGPSNGNKDHRNGNGLGNSPGKKFKRTKRRVKNKYQKSNFKVFLDFLTKLLLLAFTIYTFSVCSQDTHPQSPLCRGLAEYKRIVLDPYIMPPIQAVLVHPSVAPHIERVKPYVLRAVEVTTPILLRTQQEWNLRVVPQWEKHIVPEWKKRVVPQWNKYVVPRWDKHVATRIQHIQSTIEPYRLRAKQKYEQRILPRAQVAFYNLQRWWHQAEPYVIMAVSKTKNRYYAAKPYAIPIAKKCGHLLQRFALFLREQRQKFVDPHVAKMREKVKELSRGKQVTPEAPGHEPLSPGVSLATPETLEHGTIPSSSYSATSTYDAVATPEESDLTHSSSLPPSLYPGETTEVATQSIFAPPAITPEPELEPAVSTQFADTPTAPESFQSTASVLAEFSLESEPPAPDASVFVEDFDPAYLSVLVAATTALSSVADEPTESPSSMAPSKITVAAAKATAPPANLRADDEIDFDAFYAELGLDEPLGNPGSEPGLPNPPAETEEERAEQFRLKAEETAHKRADIEARQAMWEAELQAQMERGTSLLQNRLGNLRTAAAVELASSTDVRGSIEELVSDAEKYLKGAEIYLKNLKGESRRSDEKLALWERVADRVNDRFNERLLATEGVVNAWYRIVLDKELQEVATVATKVREVAEKGQLDLGLDYAWLEDVTYNDWQRYHALIGASERYAHEVASIQNGTHPDVVVANPMGPIFQDLESEVRDVVIGFETRFRRIKRDGERAFNIPGGIVQKEEEKGSGVEPDAGTESEASILPVPEGAGEEPGFVPPVILRRSQEEVSAALSRAEPISEAAEHPVGGSNDDPERAVSRLALEVEDGAEITRTQQ